MHIEVRKAGKRKKYYFAHSFRKFGKVKKIRVFLGYDLSKNGLDKKAEHAKKSIEERLRLIEIIHDPLHTVITPRETKEIKLLERSYDFRVFHLTKDDWKKFTREFTYNTNAIEGSTVTLLEVGQILERKARPTYRSQEEIFETTGVSEAVKFIRETKEHLSLKLIRNLHKIVFENSKAFAGRFRGAGRGVAVVDSFGNIIHRGAPSSQVILLLKELVVWYRKNRKKYSPIVLAAVVHNQFETVHPFEDGNGRVGRLLLSNILLKHGYPPVNIELKNRKEYYNALRGFQTSGNIRPMIELILKEYKNLRKLMRR